MVKCILTLVLLAPLIATPALADPAAEARAFVEDGVDRGIAILEETQPDDPARAERFRAFLGEIVDSRSVALFALGPYRRGADPALLDAYVESFRRYATASYESRLGDYGGQTIAVVNAVARSDKDVLVDGVIRSASGEDLAQVAFRIIRAPDGLRLFDLRVEGIWLAVEQRNQFSAYLGRNNGDIQRLIDYLDTETNRLNKGGTEIAEG